MKLRVKISVSIILCCLITSILIGGIALFKVEKWLKEDAVEILKGNIVKESISIEKLISNKNISIEDIKNSISDKKVLKTGYLILMKSNLDFIYHPNKEAKNLGDLDTKVAEDFKETLNKTPENVGIFFYTLKGIEKSITFIKLSNGWILSSAVTMKEFYEKINNLKIFLTIITIIVSILGIIYSLIFSKSITNPIKNIMKNLDSIAKGDLKVQLITNSKDEIGDLSKTFNNFVEKIHSIFKDIQELANEVSISNDTLTKSSDIIINGKISSYYKEISNGIDRGIVQLNEYIEDILDNVRNQTASTEESLAALEEISATSSVINENIKTTKVSFDETLEISNSSRENIIKMTKSMNEINESVDITGKEIEKLENLSTNIGIIITSINSIADQTNLLALNAAIEAARAGEAGRGFSVVADEIRKLAEQTNKETDKIENLINSVQLGVETVKKGSDIVKEKVETGLNISEISKEDIQKIEEHTKMNNKELESISSSVNEQSQASSEITVAVSNIANSSTEIEGLSLETVEISNNVRDSLLKNQEMVVELNKLVGRLKEDLNFFKI